MEKIKIITPQFERPWERDNDFIPANEKEFLEVVDSAPKDILLKMGFALWDTMFNIREETKGALKRERSRPILFKEYDEEILLIPGEWYNIIPDGFVVTDIFGINEKFVKGRSDNDIRFGALPYGIRRRVKE